MSKLVDDVKSGLKGIRGAGDAIRGEVLKATDQAFEKNPDHPTTVESRTENEAIAEKGKKDLRGADEMLARHEWKRKGVAPPTAADSMFLRVIGRPRLLIGNLGLLHLGRRRIMGLGGLRRLGQGMQHRTCLKNIGTLERG